MKVSYYELLGMIQKREIPKQIKLKLNCGERCYEANYDGDEFSFYGLAYKEEDSNFSYYLANTLLESQMIEKNIEIIEEDKDIEKITIFEHNNSIQFKNCAWTGRNLDKAFAYKINELIDEVNSLKNKG